MPHASRSLRCGIRPLWLVVLALLCTGVGRRARAEDPATPAAPPPAAPAGSHDPADPALLRKRLLARFDARTAEAATKAHLDARLLLDEVLPIPYLGIDAEPVDGTMRVEKVYPGTGAETAGLKVGDRIRSLDGEPTPSKAALGRALRKRAVGSQLAFRIERDGAEIPVTALLGHRPEEDEDEDEQFPELVESRLGPGPRVTLGAAGVGFGFECGTPGILPDELEPVLGGHGAPGRWTLLGTAPERFVRQEADDPTGIRFPMALVRGVHEADVVLRVRFRIAGGRIDRAAGLVLRWQDPGNYLVARVNTVEGDLRIFRTVNGLRRTLPGTTLKLPPTADDAAWRTLEFRAEGPRLTATVDGTSTVSSYDTYLPAGRVGLWTKSDSVTDFDDLRVEPVHALEGPPK